MDYMEEVSGTFSERAFKTVLLNHYYHPVEENTNLKIAKLLLDNGAVINLADKNGYAPYAWALMLGN